MSCCSLQLLQTIVTQGNLASGAAAQTWGAAALESWSKGEVLEQDSDR